jgi:hypothetical protein
LACAFMCVLNALWHFLRDYFLPDFYSLVLKAKTLLSALYNGCSSLIA